MASTLVSPQFFARDAQTAACALIGKVLSHRVDGIWLSARIIETEAYYRAEKASHASLGYTRKRRALFMPPGTIYMYYARGGDSFNLSCGEEGDAVLVKAGVPYHRDHLNEDWSGERERGGGRNKGGAVESPDPSDDLPGIPGMSSMLAAMHRLNPAASGGERPLERLCSGQTLLARSLNLRVPDWDGVTIGTPPLHLLDVGYHPQRLVRGARLGIPPGRDGHLPYRFVDYSHALHATRNPLARGRIEGRDYTVLSFPAGSQPGNSPQPDWGSKVFPLHLN